MRRTPRYRGCRKADDLHARYLTVVQQVNSQLEDAGDMAPSPPGLFASLWHDVEATWDHTVALAKDIVHDKALWEFISGVCNILATVAGLLALLPPLSLIFGPIAAVAALFALGSDVVLAGFDHASWAAVGMDAAALVSDAGWMKAASKLADLYKAAGLTEETVEAPTWAGLASKLPLAGGKVPKEARTARVAPGMFRMIADSLKEAGGGTNDTVKELKAIKDFAAYGTWRPIDIVAGQASWALSGGSIEAIPGNARTWVNDIATGKIPWQEPADAARPG